MKKKHYSFLDQRRSDFDVDYEEFCKSTSELHVSQLDSAFALFCANKVNANWLDICFVMRVSQVHLLVIKDSLGGVSFKINFIALSLLWILLLSVFSFPESTEEFHG